MRQIIFTPLLLEDLRTLIIECVTASLNAHQRALEKSSGKQASRDFLTLKEAANYLGLAPQTIYGLVSKGKIPYYKRGKILYFLKEELTEWLKNGRQKTHFEMEKYAVDAVKLEKGGPR